MNASSYINEDVSLYAQLTQRLTHLKSRCIQYQCNLIEQFLKESHYQQNDIVTIMNALVHGREQWGNLAGKLDIEWHAGEWSIGKADFLKTLTSNDEEFIKQKLLSKSNFSETDIKEVLQDLLVHKFDSIFKVNTSKTTESHLQYKFLQDMRIQLDKCLQNIENQEYVALNDNLQKLNHLMQSIHKVLMSKSRKINLFFNENILSNDMKAMGNEVKELVELQNKLSPINFKIT